MVSRTFCRHPANLLVTASITAKSGRTSLLDTGTDAVDSLFKGEIAQVRVWSSPCSDASLQRLVGRLGVLEADSTLLCLWKVDEGTGTYLRNSRPLQPPKAPRGSKTGTTSPGTGAEGHAELRGQWWWVSCFDPDDYVAGQCAATPSCVSVSEANGTVATTAATSGANEEVSQHRPVAESPQNMSVLAEDGSAADGSTATVPSPTLAASAGAGVDLARSLGWRSVSTAGDEDDDEADASYSQRTGDDESCVKPSPLAIGAGAVAAAAGASAALSARASIEIGTQEVSAREALLGVLGRLFQQSSVYLEPCRGDPLVERRPPPRGGRPEAKVQLQVVRREERALKAIVQAEVCLWSWLVCCFSCLDVWPGYCTVNFAVAPSWAGAGHVGTSGILPPVQSKMRVQSFQSEILLSSRPSGTQVPIPVMMGIANAFLSL